MMVVKSWSQSLKRRTVQGANVSVVQCPLWIEDQESSRKNGIRFSVYVFFNTNKTDLFFDLMSLKLECFFLKEMASKIIVASVFSLVAALDVVMPFYNWWNFRLRDMWYNKQVWPRGFHPRLQGSFSITTSISVIYYINTLKEENHKISSIPKMTTTLNIHSWYF